MIRKTVTTLSIVALAAGTMALPAAAASDTGPGSVQIAACNPCAAKARKAACNPCNPCAAKRKAACNPCAAKARKAACNPCNPCAAKKK